MCRAVNGPPTHWFWITPVWRGPQVRHGPIVDRSLFFFLCLLGSLVLRCRRVFRWRILRWAVRRSPKKRFRLMPAKSIRHAHDPFLVSDDNDVLCSHHQRKRQKSVTSAHTLAGSPIVRYDVWFLVLLLELVVVVCLLADLFVACPFDFRFGLFRGCHHKKTRAGTAHSKHGRPNTDKEQGRLKWFCTVSSGKWSLWDTPGWSVWRARLLSHECDTPNTIPASSSWCLVGVIQLPTTMAMMTAEADRDGLAKMLDMRIIHTLKNESRKHKKLSVCPSVHKITCGVWYGRYSTLRCYVVAYIR